MKLITWLKELLADEGKRFEVIRKELQEVKDKFGDEPKTEITYLDNEVSIKDLIREEDVVITISHLGISSVPLPPNTASNGAAAAAPSAAAPGKRIISNIFS
jgi:DNA gyrase/topoisomerase IV subunit A